MKRTGLLITNLGSPDAPTPAALRRYLAEFLWDRRVVDLPRLLWWPILHGIILRTRPTRSANLYQKIWDDHEPPLLRIARHQRDKLSALLKEMGHNVEVVLGMRYGHPSIAEALRGLRDEGVERLLVLPLYPQNSCSTTGSSFDAIAKELETWRFVPELRFIDNYHDHPGYIAALTESVREAWTQHPPAEKLVFSFHGTPERFRAEGDVYHDQCQATARAVADELGLAPERWMIVFQSRFGREEWLKPYADVTLSELPALGVRTVDVICPGFSADCLETLEEMAQENRTRFLRAGGGTYNYIPALNDRKAHIRALADIVVQYRE